MFITVKLHAQFTFRAIEIKNKITDRELSSLGRTIQLSSFKLEPQSHLCRCHIITQVPSQALNLFLIYISIVFHNIQNTQFQLHSRPKLSLFLKRGERQSLGGGSHKHMLQFPTPTSANSNCMLHFPTPTPLRVLPLAQEGEFFAQQHATNLNFHPRL